MFNAPGGAINNVPARNVYPGLGGATLGVTASATSGYSYSGGAAGYADMDREEGDVGPGGRMAMTGNSDVEMAVQKGAEGNPLHYWLLLLVLLVGFMYAVQKTGGEGFGNIRLSAYNILVISFAAILGISFWKTVFTRVPVPGVTTIVMGT